MPISGKDMKKLFEQKGWLELRQKGSHVVMGKGNERVSIPMHKELATGTEKTILKALKKGE